MLIGFVYMETFETDHSFGGAEIIFQSPVFALLYSWAFY